MRSSDSHSRREIGRARRYLEAFPNLTLMPEIIRRGVGQIFSGGVFIFLVTMSFGYLGTNLFGARVYAPCPACSLSDDSSPRRGAGYEIRAFHNWSTSITTLFGVILGTADVFSGENYAKAKDADGLWAPLFTSG
eukprot:COSAG05_NODE_10642_length_554_cov_0.839560_1_plen_134_part_10